MCIRDSNLVVFVEIFCTEATLCRKTLIVCVTAVSDGFISIENAVITILVLSAQIRGIDLFFFA